MLGRDRDEPTEEELELLQTLDKPGWKCGLHDPDFAEPLESTLHLERGMRYGLRFECEDESLNFSRLLAHFTFEPRDQIRDGRVLALVDQLAGQSPGGSGAAGGGLGVHLLVADSNEERDCLLSLLACLRDDPRRLRARKKAMFGCLPAPTCGAGGCVSVPKAMVRRKKKKKSKAGGDDQLGSGSAAAPGAQHLSVAGQSTPRTVLPAMAALQSHVKSEWEKMVHLRGRKQSGAYKFPLGFPATPKAGSMPWGHNPSTESLDSAAKTAKKPGVPPGFLDSERCALVLGRLFKAQECKELAKRSSVFVAGSHIIDVGDETEKWAKTWAEFFASTMGGSVGWQALWFAVEDMIMVRQLWEEPCLQKYLKDGSCLGGVTLGNWRWFLVQVQDEARDTVEAAEAYLKGMKPPDADDRGNMSLLGLAKYLTSPANGFFDPRRCRQTSDMSRPLCDYWIATAHHVHTDFGGGASRPLMAVDDAADGNSNEASAWEPKNTLEAILHSGCRAVGLAVEWVREGRDKGAFYVLLQQDRMPFSEALEALSNTAFKRATTPLILVLHLGRLSPAHSAQVPAQLQAHLGPLLFRSDRSGEEDCRTMRTEAASFNNSNLPSPDEAREKIIVVLAPCAKGWDPALEPEVPPALRPGLPVTPGVVGINSIDALSAWQNAGKDFTIWTGSPFDKELPHALLDEVYVNFVPCDELRMLERGKHQHLVEYHRNYLTLAFPVAPRAAPANFNPATAWNCGVQMAAVGVSLGSSDGAVLAHAGRFCEDNGGCGYVLKPSSLRMEVGRLQTDGGALAKSDQRVRLEIRLLAARAPPRVGESASLVSVAVSVWGASADCARQVYKPVRPEPSGLLAWPEALPAADRSAPKPLSFSIGNPGCAVLVLELLELDATLGGTRRAAFFAAPVDGLRQGLRWAPLWTLGPMGDPRPTPYGRMSGVLVHAAIKSEPRVAAR